MENSHYTQKFYDDDKKYEVNLQNSPANSGEYSALHFDIDDELFMGVRNI